MERPAPLDLLALTNLIFAENEGCALKSSFSGCVIKASFWKPGKSTSVVTLVYGPDADEVESVKGQLSAAALDVYKWQALEGPPEDLS